MGDMTHGAQHSPSSVERGRLAVPQHFGEGSGQPHDDHLKVVAQLAGIGQSGIAHGVGDLLRRASAQTGDDLE